MIFFEDARGNTVLVKSSSIKQVEKFGCHSKVYVDGSASPIIVKRDINSIMMELEEKLNNKEYKVTSE
ncbi:hypothetical protein [Tatumella citrea]|uniref:Uncharacterized protein n=1 Tax=Tatumella citrea TaxID=53336 RepID=A0A1Y0LLT2_TATCI|nr:hypothetical protein [Tatumella citrea]ARU94602.1 hypothetical protein A7K98_13030 [Tatumella citrea]ARU98640.1 hypothetical protein A7K99_13020 [Tatumella citrea]